VKIKKSYCEANDYAGYDVKLEYQTQKQLENHFAAIENQEQNQRIKYGLFELISNVLLFEEEDTPGEMFHFRI